MKCLICGEENFKCIHRGTRDVLDINVMKCKNCGMVQLDSFEQNTEENYEGGGMLKDTYAATVDEVADMAWQTWIKETMEDDDRRFEVLKEICTGKEVLEFGCGNGGFLRRIKSVASSVTGVELMKEARENLKREGIETYEILDDIKHTYDVICMFMVIEHLNNPDYILKMIYDVLKPGGFFICETPNADDALISKYECKEFENFTYWSKHVRLFTSTTLEKLLLRNGYKTKHNTQIQRYSLANHLYWLSNGKPGGHVKWAVFNEQKLAESYAECLISQCIADTLWYIGRKT